MNDKFDPNEAEPRIRAFWDKERAYHFDKGSSKPVYPIDTPPPTISGFIHIGHVFSYSQADFIARYRRMRGFNVFYPFGFDNNGLPTEILVEKDNKTTAEREGREKFIQMVHQVSDKYIGIYTDVWKQMGISADWSLQYTTIGEDSRRISQLSFIELYKMGRAYRKETPSIWCIKCRTSISQMELEDKVLKSKFYDIKFSDDVTIATTRPELLGACVAVFVNPDDKKNSRLVGKKVRVPIFGQEVEVLADKRVDMEKGTGMVMCCTFGDLVDIEWYMAYSLPLRIIIDDRGIMSDGPYKGMKIGEAREAIAADLKSKGCVTKENDIEHTVNVHERCKTEIEFIVKKQWFIKYLDLKEKLIELGKGLDWHPEYMFTRYKNWVNGLQWDWSISRQRYYGIPFPVWYCKKCGEALMADEKNLPVDPVKDAPKAKCLKCSSQEFEAETDVMDTWATSSVTPLINMKWRSAEELKSIYPMALRPQGNDIISTWLFTTVVKCYLHTGMLPWKSVFIAGHALDSKGRPMHKSVGNIVEPKEIVPKYGTDALRYWASLSRLGEDARFQDKDLVAANRLANKMWNVAKFVGKSSKVLDYSASKPLDRWLLSRLMLAVKDATDRFDAYDYSNARRVVEEFFWFFSDNYLEFIKYRVYGNDSSQNYALNTAFLYVVKMLAPFMPYLTEELYSGLFAKDAVEKSVHVSAWPAYSESMFSKEDYEKGEKACAVIAAIRQWKHDMKMALNAELSELVISERIEGFEDDIRGAMKIKALTTGSGGMPVQGTGITIEPRA